MVRMSTDREPTPDYHSIPECDGCVRVGLVRTNPPQDSPRSQDAPGEPSGDDDFRAFRGRRDVVQGAAGVGTLARSVGGPIHADGVRKREA
jgi:hypothetical protein